MNIVLLRYTDNRSLAGRFMDEHKAWIKRGFEDGVFVLVGSLEPDAGGGIFAHRSTLESLQRRLADDPFVREGIVRAEVVEISPVKVDSRLAFLAGG